MHEPKGASLAAAGKVYVATGQGSGVWDHMGSESLKGLAGTIPEGMAVLSDGSGGFKFVPYVQYGSIAITNNNGSFTLDEAVDEALNTNSDYKMISGVGAPWSADLNYNVGPETDGLTVNNNGVYKVEAWIDISQYPSNAAKLAVKYVVNSNQFSARKVTSTSNANGDAGNLVGFGMVSLTAGATVRLAMASTVAGTTILESANLTLTLVRAL